MPFAAAGILQISRGAQKDSRHVHQLAEGEVGNQKTDEKEMNIEEQSTPFGSHGVKTDIAMTHSFTCTRSTL